MMAMNVHERRRELQELASRRDDWADFYRAVQNGNPIPPGGAGIGNVRLFIEGVLKREFGDKYEPDPLAPS